MVVSVGKQMRVPELTFVEPHVPSHGQFFFLSSNLADGKIITHHQLRRSLSFHHHLPVLTLHLAAA